MESGLGSGPTGYFMDASRLDEEFPQVDPGCWIWRCLPGFLQCRRGPGAVFGFGDRHGFGWQGLDDPFCGGWSGVRTWQGQAALGAASRAMAGPAWERCRARKHFSRLWVVPQRWSSVPAISPR